MKPLDKYQVDALRKMLKKMDDFNKRDAAKKEAIEMLKEQHEKEIKLLSTYLYYVKYRNAGLNK